VYGLFGYAMVVEFQEQKIRYGLPPSIYMFMLAWLVMGFMGILKLFGFGEIANFAHLGGLASGIFFAMILVMYKKTTLLR
jgi:GlpG protein